MSYQSPYKEFIFKSYVFNKETCEASFTYTFDNERTFVERIQFSKVETYEPDVFDRVLQLAFILAGISYYKTFPVASVRLPGLRLSPDQASFFEEVYRDGLSQFVYENNLDPTMLPSFEGTGVTAAATPYAGQGTLVLQSGGKDSLLLAELLTRNNHHFSAWHMSQSNAHPSVLNSFTLRTATRKLDLEALSQAAKDGALNGHVPVTYITLAYALADAVLHGENTILAAIGHEGEEPHAYIGDYPVTHQWSKTWRAEELFSTYVTANISPDLRVGSPLRQMSELKIAERFASVAWKKYGNSFSSCNLANYKQGHDNRELHWCGNCPKCANSFLLFAAYVPEPELVHIFGSNLFTNPMLEDTFKGLLGIGGIIKPFECVGEIDELRKAYELALESGYEPLAFTVPISEFTETTFDHQEWAAGMVQLQQ